MIYVDTVSITEEYMVHGAHGIGVQTEDTFEEVNFAEFDMVILPGGQPGTTNLSEHEGVKRVIQGAVIVKAPVVQDGNIITSRGMGTAIDFGLKLVEILFDKAEATALAETIIYLK